MYVAELLGSLHVQYVADFEYPYYVADFEDPDNVTDFWDPCKKQICKYKKPSKPLCCLKQLIFLESPWKIFKNKTKTTVLNFSQQLVCYTVHISNSEPAKWFGFGWIRISNTALNKTLAIASKCRISVPLNVFCEDDDVKNLFLSCPAPIWVYFGPSHSQHSQKLLIQTFFTIQVEFCYILSNFNV